MSNAGKETITLTLTVEQARMLMDVTARLEQSLNDIQLEDGLYQEALKYSRTLKTVGPSQLQRVFKIGYNRAARLIDRMLESGDLSRERLND